MSPSGTMLASGASQTVGSARITGDRALRALLAFLQDARDFIQDNPALLVVLVVLGVVVFQATRPKVS